MTSNKTLYPPLPASPMTPGLWVAHGLCLGLSVIVAKAAWSFQNKESAMAFYGVYHRDGWNQLIHFFGVPGIIWSILMCQAHLPLTSTIILRMPLTQPHLITWATVWFASYTIFYITIDPIGAVLYLPFMYTFYATSVNWTVDDQRRAKKKYGKVSWTGTGRILRIAGVVQFLSWYVQIHPGHLILEGAAPAVTQSIGGALTTAPLFAFYEAIWLAGFRRDFHQAVLRLVDQYTAELCRSGVVMRACESLSM